MIIRRCKIDNAKAWVYARITVNGIAAELSLQQKILKGAWDTKKEVVTGDTEEAKNFNDDIVVTRLALKGTWAALVKAGAIVTALTVKTAYLKSKGVRAGKKLVQLTAYFIKIWTEKLRWGSMKNYHTTVDYLHAFLAKEFVGKEVYLEDINMQFANDFEHHIRTCPLNPAGPCLGNGVSKHIQRFKRMLNWAKEIGWLKENGCEKYACQLKKSRRKKLTTAELRSLEETPLEDASLEFIRDLFVFSCYTGFAFADVTKLQRSDFETDESGIIWCKIYRTKSEVLAPVPLLPKAVDILTRYRQGARTKNRPAIFPRITNQQVNRGLKAIRSACDIDTPVTFHVARHTFAKTVALKNGVPLETVQMMLGHTKIATTQLYAEVDEEKILCDMNVLREKLGRIRH